MGFSPTLIRELKATFSSEALQFEVPLSRLSTLRTGGVAAAMLSIASLADLEKVFLFLKRSGVLYIPLGKASNVIFPDGNWPVILLRAASFLPKVSGEEIEFSAATPLLRAIRVAHGYKLMGMEGAIGIPGTVGGAVVMNAGSGSWEAKDQITRIKAVRGGDLVEEGVAGLDLNYRSSNLTGKDFIFSTTFKFFSVGADKIKGLQKECIMRLNERKLKQPLSEPSVGSTFKNPLPYYAGQLIEESGLKGTRVGGIGVSRKHANFIVNLGGGTSLQACKLIELVQREVERKTGILLEPEVKIF